MGKVNAEMYAVSLTAMAIQGKKNSFVFWHFDKIAMPE